jgi:hypothetical protein
LGSQQRKTKKNLRIVDALVEVKTGYPTIKVWSIAPGQENLAAKIT